MADSLSLLDLSAARRELVAQRGEVIPPKTGVAIAKRQFSAAKFDRFTADWAASILSRDQKLNQDLRKLRARSRELADNEPLAAKYLMLCESNVVGPKGITMQAKVKNLRGGQLADDVNQELETEWAAYGERGNCTADGLLSFRELEWLVIRTVAMDGEFLAIIKPADNPWGVTLQVIDVDQLDTTYNVGAGPKQNEIRMGVEVDASRRPLAYWIYSGHPSETMTGNRSRVRIPAEFVMHLYRPDSARQTRGVPWMAPGMYRLNMLRGYDEAELVAARVGACQGFAIESEDSGDDDAFEGDGANEDDTTSLEMTPGGGIRLAPGEKLTAISPEHPTTAYASFTKECRRAIAQAWGVSYTSLTDDLEGVNFSSIRAGLLNERDRWRVLQKWIIEQFHKRFFAVWLEYAALRGRVDISVRDEAAILAQLKWHPRGWDWVDPKNDQNANVLAVENGFTTRSRILAERGYDLEDTYKELAEEEALAKKYGLTLGTDTKGVADTADDDQGGGDEPGGVAQGSGGGGGKSQGKAGK